MNAAGWLLALAGLKTFFLAHKVAVLQKNACDTPHPIFSSPSQGLYIDRRMRKDIAMAPPHIL